MMNEQEKLAAKIMERLKGVELSDKEIRTINWLAKWDNDTVDSVCSLLAKTNSEGYIEGLKKGLSKVKEDDKDDPVDWIGYEL